MITLPWPPTVNTYWRMVNNRMLLSAKGRSYRKAVQDCVTVQRPYRHGDSLLTVVIQLHPPDNRRRDIDNLTKGLLDGLAKAGVYDDDSQIKRLTLVMNAPDKDNPRADVTVVPQ